MSILPKTKKIVNLSKKTISESSPEAVFLRRHANEESKDRSDKYTDRTRKKEYNKDE